MRMFLAICFTPVTSENANSHSWKREKLTEVLFQSHLTIICGFGGIELKIQTNLNTENTGVGTHLFDDMWYIPRLNASACSNSCQLVSLQPIIISILFHHYKELEKCMFEVEQLEDRVVRRAATVKLQS